MEEVTGVGAIPALWFKPQPLGREGTAPAVAILLWWEAKLNWP